MFGYAYTVQEITMKVTLNKFTTMWDEAALETLGSEFYMMDLLDAQPIINPDGSSILDYLVFDGEIEIDVPEKVAQEVTYFKAPWDESE